jgi:large subunit ribosomal protein L25
MEKVVLKADARQVIGKQVKALRREGLLPAVIYGRGIEPMPISLGLHEASRVLPGVSSSQLIEVEVDGKPHTTLVRERQRHPITGALLHIDFQEVSMTETLRTVVSFHLHGEAPAVTRYGGILVSGLEELLVECLPGDLPEHIEVDISSLQEIGDAIHVRDIQAPAGVEILSDPEDMIVLITAPSAAEEEEVVAAEAEPEVIEKGKKEEENY